MMETIASKTRQGLPMLLRASALALACLSLSQTACFANTMQYTGSTCRDGSKPGTSRSVADFADRLAHWQR